MHDFTGSWWNLLSFLNFCSLCCEMLVRENFRFFELTIVMMMHIICCIVSSPLFEFGNGSSLHLTVIIFLEADNVSPNFGIFFGITSLFDWCLGEVVGGWSELTAVWSFVDLEVDDFLVCINKMLIFILIFQAISKRILLYITSMLELLIDKRKKVPDFVCFWPKVGLNLGKDQHSIDLHLKRPMSGESDELLFWFIVVSFDFCVVSWAPTPVFGVVRWRFILRNSRIGIDFFGFADDTMEEVLIFFLLMARAPLMEVAIDAMFNLDMHVLN